MVRNYQRKGKRCKWTLEQLNEAIKDVVNKVSSVRAPVKHMAYRENEKLKSSKRKLQLTTSEEKQPVKKSKKQKRAKTVSVASCDIWKCAECGTVYGEHDDPKLSEDWLSCRCGKKYHFSCGEVNGVLDDDDILTCKNCM